MLSSRAAESVSRIAVQPPNLTQALLKSRNSHFYFHSPTLSVTKSDRALLGAREISRCRSLDEKSLAEAGLEPARPFRDTGF